MRSSVLRYATLWTSAFVVFSGLVDAVVRHEGVAAVGLGGIYFWMTLKSRSLPLWYPVLASIAVAATGIPRDLRPTLLDVQIMVAAAAWLLAVLARAYFERNSADSSAG